MQSQQKAVINYVLRFQELAV